MEENSHCLFQDTIHTFSTQVRSETLLAHYFLVLSIYVPPQDNEMPHI